MVYQFKEGKTYKGIDDAQIVGETLEQIRVKNGGKLLTEAVLRSAKSQKSPLHPAFTWNDTKAAIEYRKWEANHLVKSVCIISEEGEQIPAFVNVRLSEEGEKSEVFYQSISVITHKPDEYESAISICRNALEVAERNLNILLSLVPVSKKKSIRNAISSVKTARVQMSA